MTVGSALSLYACLPQLNQIPARLLFRRPWLDESGAPICRTALCFYVLPDNYVIAPETGAWNIFSLTFQLVDQTGVWRTCGCILLPYSMISENEYERKCSSCLPVWTRELLKYLTVSPRFSTLLSNSARSVFWPSTHLYPPLAILYCFSFFCFVFLLCTFFSLLYWGQPKR